MPETIVYWNRCETKVNQYTQTLVKKEQIDSFHNQMGIKLHDYPDLRVRVAKEFPLLDDKEIWADSRQEKFVNSMESLIYQSEEVKSWIQQLPKQRPVEGQIIIENPRETDVFFNSKFESGNLRQAFIVPQPSDFDELTDEEAMVGDYLPKAEQEYIRNLIQQRKEKKREVALQSLSDPKLQIQSQSVSQEQSEAELQSEKSEIQAEEPNRDTANNSDLYQDDGPKLALEFSQYANPTQLSPLSRQLQQKQKQTKLFSEYNLYLQDDTHSDGSRTQWYYFSTMNIKAGTNMKINIVNMTKPESSYTKGMQPLVFSTKRFKKTGVGWHRAGKNITYVKNGRTQRSQIKIMDIKYLQGQQSDEQQQDSFKALSTFSFEYKFKFDFDVVYFAHFQPYTYNDCANYMCKLESESQHAEIMRIDHLCNSVGKNPIYCLTITNKIKTKYVTAGKENFKWQKFEYTNNQNVDFVKPKKSKKEEVCDSEEEKLDSSPRSQQQAINVNPFELQPKKQTSFSKSNFNQQVPVPEMMQKIEQQSLLQKTGRLSRIPEVPQETESNYHPDEDKIQGKANVNRHFDQKPDFDTSSEEEKLQAKKKKEMRDKFYKKCIVITARVHPGETQSSFMVEGLINYLLSDDLEAKEIREKFVIKIIPMLNPDGVILGNTRSSLMGVDLNRRWQKPSKFLHPTIYYTKSLIKYFNKKFQQPEVKSGGVVLFTDIHGHNKNNDIFMYGCTMERDYAQHEGNMLIRAIPDGVDRLIPVFSTHKCKFAVEPNKVETGRIVVFREFNIMNSYTLESSFYGSEYLIRTKQIYMALYSQEYLQSVNQRYQISAQRQSIQFDTNSYFQASADFIKGVNWSCKRKPLLTYMFRIEPKSYVDYNSLNKQIEEPEVDELKELESRWRPTGNILDDGKSGMTEKFGGPNIEYIFDGPPVDDKLEKVARRKKEKAEKLQKKRQLEAMLLQRQQSTDKKIISNKDQKPLNADIAVVSSKPKSQSRKNSGRRNQSRSKTQNSNGQQITKRKAKGLSKIDEVGKLVQNQSDYDEEEDDDVQSGQSSALSQDEGPQEAVQLRLLSQNQARHQSQKSESALQIASVQESKTSTRQQSGAKSVYKMADLDSPAYEPHQILLKSFQAKGDMLEIVEQSTPRSKGKLLLTDENILGSGDLQPVQISNNKFLSRESPINSKHSKKNYKLNVWEKQLAVRNQFVVKIDIAAIENRRKQSFAKDQNQFGATIRDQTLENFAKASINHQSASSNTLTKAPELAFKHQDSSTMKLQYNSLGYSIENSESDDELTLPPIFPNKREISPQNSQNLLLASDPLVMSSEQLEKYSRVKFQTLAMNQRDFLSPQNSKKNNIFAPMNGVYSQKSLMTNSAIAERKNINFIVEKNSGIFTQRKMTQLQKPSKSIIDAELWNLLQMSERRNASPTNSSQLQAIQIKNGFELSPEKQESVKRLQRLPSSKKKFMNIARPHIILKPLSNVDWQTIQSVNSRNNTNRTFDEMSEHAQRKSLKNLKKFIGVLEIKKNKLTIGRNQALTLENLMSPQRNSPKINQNFSQSNLEEEEISVPRGQRKKNYMWPAYQRESQLAKFV